jgi:16S rRNA (uracil1498-N3)-methyltransferase
MECLFFEDFDMNSTRIYIDGDEFKHLKALRVNINENIYISNGKGLIANAMVEVFKNHSTTLKIIEINNNINEDTIRIALALGIIENKDRFEFALEKSVELGITDFYPLISDYSTKRNINNERLKKKVISALKQSRRSYLTKIHESVNLYNSSGIFNQYKNILVADFDGIIFDNKIETDTLFIIGPEGGFSKKDRDFMKLNLNPTIISLGERRLRAETAAIYCLSVFNYQGNMYGSKLV